MTTPRWLLIVVIVGAAGIAVGRHTARTPDVAAHESATETIAAAETQEATETVDAMTTIPPWAWFAFGACAGSAVTTLAIAFILGPPVPQAPNSTMGRLAEGPCGPYEAER